MRAARFLTCRMPRPAIRTSLAFFKMLCDFANEIAEEGFTSPLGQLMFLGQSRSKVFECNGRLSFGRSDRFLCFNWQRHDGFPPKSAKCAFEGKI